MLCVREGVGLVVKGVLYGGRLPPFCGLRLVEGGEHNKCDKGEAPFSSHLGSCTDATMRCGYLLIVSKPVVKVSKHQAAI